MNPRPSADPPVQSRWTDGCLLASLLSLIAGAACAQPVPVFDGQPSLEDVTPKDAAAESPAARETAEGNDAQAYAALGRTRPNGAAHPPPAWAGRSRGVGDAAPSLAPASAADTRPVAGAKLLQRVHLTLEASNLAAPFVTPLALQDQVARMDDAEAARDVLQMRRAKSSLAGLRGAFKFEVAPQSYFVVKPRRSRVSVEFRSSW